MILLILIFSNSDAFQVAHIHDMNNHNHNLLNNNNEYGFAQKSSIKKSMSQGSLEPFSRKSMRQSIRERYKGYVNVGDNLIVSGLQAAKKIKHAIALGIDPKDYGMTQQDCEAISTSGGIFVHGQNHGLLPTVEDVNAFQTEIRNFNNLKATVRSDNVIHYGAIARPAIAMYNKELRILSCYDV
jgi:hypothetical protein